MFSAPLWGLYAKSMQESFKIRLDLYLFAGLLDPEIAVSELRVGKSVAKRIQRLLLGIAVGAPPERVAFDRRQVVVRLRIGDRKTPGRIDPSEYRLRDGASASDLP